MKTNKIYFRMATFVACAFLFFSCKGGLAIVYGEIEGLDSLKETHVGEYKIAIEGATGVEYFWSLVPNSAGLLYTPTKASTKFTPNDVNYNTNVTIMVSAITDQHGAIVKSKEISILNREGWVRTWGNEGWSYAEDVVSSIDNTIYVIGNFYGVVDFDPTEMIDAQSSNNGSNDVFTSVFHSNGDYIGIYLYGGPDYDGSGNIDIDIYGNVYVQKHRIFPFRTGIRKYDNIGTVIWTRNYPFGMADFKVGNSNNFYNTGSFTGTVDFDPNDGLHEITAKGESDAFLLKLNYEGELDWVRTWGGFGDYLIGDVGSGISLDGDNNIYVVGTYGGKDVDFDPGGSYEIHSAQGQNEFYLCKYNTEGIFQWVKTWGGNGGGYMLGIELRNDLVYIYGGGDEYVDFNPGPEINKHEGGGEFVCTFTKNGDFDQLMLWDRSMDISDIAVDKLNNIYMTGYYEGQVDIDPGPNVKFLIQEGEKSAYLIKLDQNGGLQWVKSWGTELAAGRGLGLDSMDNVYVVGIFTGTVDFDTSDGFDIRTSNGEGDCFLVKFPPDGEW